MKKILFVSALSLALVFFGSSVNSTELNGELKSEMNASHLETVVVNREEKSDRLVPIPIPDRNPIRVMPTTPPLPERKPKRETFDFDGTKHADGGRGTLTHKDRCATPHFFGDGKLPPECYLSGSSWEI